MIKGKSYLVMSKKINLLLICFLLFMNLTAVAQSTIYFFYGKTGGLNMPLQIKFNGKETFLLKKETKKTCFMKNEGLLTVSFEKSFSSGPYNIPVSWADEIQLTLTKNSVHYIKLSMKKAGYVMAFEELTEEEGIKELKKKNYDEVHPYNEQ